MNRVTTRDLIREVAIRWRRQYPLDRDGDTYEIYVRLSALDGETATADAVNAIIGNSSWTCLRCDECGGDVGAVTQIGESPDYESATADVCDDCLRAAIAMMPAAPVTDGGTLP